MRVTPTGNSGTETEFLVLQKFGLRPRITKKLCLDLAKDVQRLAVQDAIAGKPTRQDSENCRCDTCQKYGRPREFIGRVENLANENRRKNDAEAAADETCGRTDDSELRAKHPDQSSARSADGFEDRNFPHAPVTSSGNAGSEDNESSEYRESGDEPDGQTHSIHDVLDDLEDVGGIDHGNGRKLLEDSGLDRSYGLGPCAHRTVVHD